VRIDWWAVAVVWAACAMCLAASAQSWRWTRRARVNSDEAISAWQRSATLAGLTLKLCQALPLDEAEQQLYDELTALEAQREREAASGD
jgi:inorganic triphosphatase YgiF